MIYNLIKLLIISGGIRDLEQKIIRTVGNRLDRFNDDPLRIQRVLRFLTQFNSQIEEELAEAIIQTRQLITKPTNERPTSISSERIFHELSKAFNACDKFRSYLDLLDRLGLWQYLLLLGRAFLIKKSILAVIPSTILLI